MNWRIIKILIAKDFRLFFRDKFFGFVTIFSIILYLVIYFLMPKSINETVKIGFYTPEIANTFFKNVKTEGLILQQKKTEDELKKAIMEKKLHIGILIPGGMQKSPVSSKTPQIFIYYSSDVSDEMKDMYTLLMGEMTHKMSGTEMNIDKSEIILGPDMGGKQIPYRDRMLPLFLLMLLLTETLGLANLISSEIERGTIHALVVTPMRVVDLFVGKGITGLLLAFSPAFILLILTGNLTRNISLITVSLLLGSMMVTGMAFFIASISKNMMSVVGWGTLLMIFLLIPPIAVIVPGPVSGWIKGIPSFFLGDILHRAVNFDIGWSGNFNNIMFLIGFNIIFVLLGIAILKRKVT